MNLIDIVAILPNFIDLSYKLIFNQDPDVMYEQSDMVNRPGDIDGHNLLPTYDNTTLYEPYSITPTISNAEKGMPKIVVRKFTSRKLHRSVLCDIKLRISLRGAQIDIMLDH